MVSNTKVVWGSFRRGRFAVVFFWLHFFNLVIGGSWSCRHWFWWCSFMITRYLRHEIGCLHPVHSGSRCGADPPGAVHCPHHRR